jgi:hypothetical protein
MNAAETQGTSPEISANVADYGAPDIPFSVPKQIARCGTCGDIVEIDKRHCDQCTAGDQLYSAIQSCRKALL